LFVGGVYPVMDRKHLAVGLCIILAVGCFLAFTWNKGRAPASNQTQVVTQGGSVTLTPKDGFATFVVVADLRATNTQSKTSSPAATPQPR
jgi:hypothetical protein